MIKDVMELKDKFDVFIFDVFGVIWDGKKPINKTIDAMLQLKNEGKKIIVLSNSASPSRYTTKFREEVGIVKGKHFDELVTSGDLAEDLLKNCDKMKYYVFGKYNDRLFDDTKHDRVDKFENADFVYVGAPIRTENGEDNFCCDVEVFVPELEKFLNHGKTLMCANPDVRVYVKNFDKPVFYNGAIAQKYIEMGGEVETIGKPYPLIFDFALKNFPDVDDERILMIGDTLETDILGGNTYGIKTALMAGGIASYNMKQEGFDSLEEYAEEVGVVPDYFLER